MESSSGGKDEGTSKEEQQHYDSSGEVDNKQTRRKSLGKLAAGFLGSLSPKRDKEKEKEKEKGSGSRRGSIGGAEEAMRGPPAGTRSSCFSLMFLNVSFDIACVLSLVFIVFCLCAVVFSCSRGVLPSSFSLMLVLLLFPHFVCVLSNAFTAFYRALLCFRLVNRFLSSSFAADAPPPPPAPRLHVPVDLARVSVVHQLNEKGIYLQVR